MYLNPKNYWKNTTSKTLSKVNELTAVNFEVENNHNNINTFLT